MKKTKIEVKYPNGHIDCQENSVDTYRNVIRFLGLKNVRKCNICYNGINIVSTRAEMKDNETRKNDPRRKGSPQIEKNCINTLERNSDLGICTQFNNRDKNRIIEKLNAEFNTGLKVRLIELNDD